jgi:hypothetical protein
MIGCNGVSLLLNIDENYGSTYTGHTQKNGAVSKVNKRNSFLDMLESWLLPTPTEYQL